MLTENDIKEELSYAYLHAIASRAGFACENVRKDRDSIDVHLCARGELDPSSTVTSPILAVQLKASVIDPLPDDVFDFRLTRKNYDDLRAPQPMVPRILVVFVMPKNKAKWLKLSEKALSLQRCAYWRSLAGAPDSVNEEYQKIRIDRKNTFTVEALRSIMVQVSRQEDITHGA